MITYSDLSEVLKITLIKNGVDNSILTSSTEIIRSVYNGFSDEEIFFSLNPSIASITSPYIFPEMSKSIKRLIKSLKKGENILIFGDRDADGIIATFILKDFLEKFKKTLESSSRIYFKLPEEDEDYGISTYHIDEFADKVSLIITVDNGISAVDAIKKAKENKIDTIILDHHEFHNPEISNWAFSIVDPKKDKIGKEYLSGAGVTFYFIIATLLYHYYGNLEVWYFNKTNGDIKLVRIKDFIGREYTVNEVIRKGYKLNVLLSDANEKNTLKNSIKEIEDIIDRFVFFSDVYSFFSNRKKDLNEVIEEFGIPSFSLGIIERILLSIHLKYDNNLSKFVNSYAPLVGLTVFSDSMPIVSENKFFTTSALSKITKSEFESIRYLCSELSNGDDKVSIFDIIMRIIPFINAPGRMGKAEMMIEFLMEKDIKNLTSIFSSINNLNREKIRIVNELVNRLITRVGEVVIFEKGISKGIISLVSTRLSNYTDKPVIVIGDGGEYGKLVGSARFRRGNIFSLLKSMDDYFLNFGGHRRAAGFIMDREKLDKFIEAVKNTNFDSYFDSYKPLANISIKEFMLKYINLIRLIEPLSPDMRPSFESYETIKEYNPYGRIKYAVIDKFKVICELPEDEVKVNLSKRTKIIYSYEYRFDSDVQEEVIYPKILKMENE